jgi:hypothetical protein
MAEVLSTWVAPQEHCDKRARVDPSPAETDADPAPAQVRPRVLMTGRLRVAA